jgi:hypothetical protein
MADVEDIDVGRADRATDSREVSPETLLKVALRDCAEFGDVASAYILLIRAPTGDREQGSTLAPYRANMTHPEEIAFLNAALHDAIEEWTGRE